MRTVLIVALIALTSPAAAQDRMDACQEYPIEEALGSLLASGHKRVCAYLGPQLLTNACMTYYTLLTDPQFPLRDDTRARLAAECDASMAGGAGLPVCQNDTGCLPGSDLITPPAAPPQVPPDTGTAPGGDAVECGVGLECRPEPDDLPEPVYNTEPMPAQGSPAPSAGVTATDAALDLAFWEAIKDSGDASLFRAYLAQFPQGTFRVIAEARLTALTAPPAAPPMPADAAAILAPAGLFDQAEAIMAAAYALDVAQWDAEARRAMPLYEAAGQGGHAPAWVELGALYENGIGTAQDNRKALSLYLQAGDMGFDEGYYRALMVADQLRESEIYVQTFLALYRSDPALAYDSFNAVSSAGPRWLQGFLQAQGFYGGALDGAFGAGSRAALEGFAAAGRAAPAAAPQEADALALALQQELQRVGCYQGAIDGLWGAGSTRALEAFDHWMGGIGITARPTDAALAVVRAARGMVCGVD